MALNPLIHYSMENPASIYDEEAMTALELAGRTAGKVNEAILAFNKLENDTNEHLSQQDTQIPKKVEQSVQHHINEGDFDRQISKYAGELEQRLDNLFAGYTEGSTNLDAEVIDARLGFNGKAYPNAGTAIRESVHEAIHVHAGNYSEVLPDLDQASEGRYLINIATATGPDGLPANMPFDWCPSPVVLLANIHTGQFNVQVMVTNTDLYIRYGAGGSWRPWHDVNNSAILVASTNYSIFLPDANRATKPVYLLLFAKGDTNLPANLPFTVFPGGLGCLENHVHDDGYIFQTLRIDGTTYTRGGHIDGLGGWESEYEGWIDVNSSNYQFVLPDLNTATPGDYLINFGTGTLASDMPANMPFASCPSTLFKFSSRESATFVWQEISFHDSEVVYKRWAVRNSGMGGWSQFYMIHATDGVKTVVVPSGGSILRGVKEAYATGCQRVVVEAGGYDIMNEYRMEYGEDYWDNYTDYSRDVFDRGIWLENIELIFAPGAKVFCYNTYANQNIRVWFSPFATGNNVVIDGLNLVCTYCRYGIHPDFNTGTHRTTFVMRNCDLTHYTSTENQQVVGCGFGIHVDWLFENCIFRSSNAVTVLRIHNNVNPTAESRAVFRNCYIDGPGYFVFNRYSTSTAKSQIIVTGCSYINPPVLGDESGADADNMALLAYNNEIRT